MLTPFDYQLEAINELRQAARTARRMLLCMLMGAGKSLVAMELMRLCSDKGKKSLFICDRRMLADQAKDRAEEQGLKAGLIMAGRCPWLSAPCQFAMKQTVESWLKQGRLNLPEFELIICDEAHRATSERWKKLYAFWPRATFVGLTATPCLGNGDGMGAYYDYLAQPITPSGLRAMGRIVPVRAFAPHVPNLAGVKKDKDGDYAAASLSRLLNRKNLIGDVCGWWKRVGENRPSIYFACDVAHATSIRDEFRDQGVSAELICDATSDDDRADIRRRCEAGDVKVVVNVDVLSEGVDWPFIELVGIVRPTKRLRRYLQNTGRGLRSSPGKKDLLILDHAGCVHYHGFPDTDREWSLGENIDEKEARKKPPGESSIMTCVQCFAVFSGSRTCPECGHVHAVPKGPAKDYAQKNGTLIEVNGGDLPEETTQLLRQRFWGVCIGTAVKRNRKAGAAAGMFSGKFGIPPWQAGVHPLPEGCGQWQEPARDVFPGFVRGGRE